MISCNLLIDQQNFILFFIVKRRAHTHELMIELPFSRIEAWLPHIQDEDVSAWPNELTFSFNPVLEFFVANVFIIKSFDVLQSTKESYLMAVYLQRGE